MELGKSLRQMINESSVKVVDAYKDEYGDNWKVQCVESIDNEVAKAEASLKYWKGVRAKVMVAK
jgi:KaiC/GvpD/RAD55 family RecA-like ATPase